MRVFSLASAAAVYSLGMDHDLHAGRDDLYLASFIVSYKMHFAAAFRTGPLFFRKGVFHSLRGETLKIILRL